MRLWPNWIRHLSSEQGIASSSLARRTICPLLMNVTNEGHRLWQKEIMRTQHI